eukprot:TRINITY_DN6242_c0_g1_i1.p1 TRINITY_DN6242_c0_g1~~TRINITY_DN6242_c0_g1_i1.p1  ORF type:complete len:223 (-),score=52.82 TRINITY_DN6242_c0_g1_i1:91-759(-)
MNKSILYYYPISQPSRALWQLSLELNIEIEMKVVDLPKGEHKSKDFLEINPTGQVPALRDGNFTLFESAAIAQYLCEKNNDKQWFGKDVQTKGLVNQYLHWHHNNLRKAALAFFFTVLAPRVFGQGDYSKKIQEGKDAAYKAVEHIEKVWLSKQKYLCGEYITFADLQAAHELLQVTLAGLVDVSQYPNVSRWLSEIEKENNTQEVLKGLKGLVESIKNTSI